MDTVLQITSDGAYGEVVESVLLKIVQTYEDLL
jgi:hypothetical protein